jgi:hypothetical protein
MRVHTSSLVAMFALLFGLYAPLCSLACLNASGGEGVAAVAGEPPCHGDSATQTPVDAPVPEDDCGCAAPYALKAPLPVEAMGGTIGGAEGATARPLLPAIADAAPYARRASLVRDLAIPPPRDVMLVTTTLLI